MKNLATLFLILMLLSLSGCEAVEALFSAGVYTGVFIIVFVIVVVIFILFKLGKRD